MKLGDESDEQIPNIFDQIGTKQKSSTSMKKKDTMASICKDVDDLFEIDDDEN